MLKDPEKYKLGVWNKMWNELWKETLIFTFEFTLPS